MFIFKSEDTDNNTGTQGLLGFPRSDDTVLQAQEKTNIKQQWTSKPGCGQCLWQLNLR
jgi:hypothetical protein